MKFIILTALFVVAAATYDKDSTGSIPVYSTTASESTYSSSASVAPSSSVSDSSYSSPSFSTPTYSELTYTTVVHPTETTSGSVYSVSQSDAVHINTSGEDDEDDDDDEDDETDNGSHAQSESLTQEDSNYATTSLVSSSNGKPEYTTDSNVAEIDSAPAYQAPGTGIFNEELSVAVPSVYETPVTAGSVYEENANIPPNFLPYWLRPSATKSY